MAVVQLQDDTGANLGSALGAAAGYFATQKQRKTDKAAATARQAATDTRVNQEAADTHANIQDLIKDRDATAQRTAANDTTTQLSTGAKQKYLPMLASPPTTDGKALTGPALTNALYAIRTKAINEGMTGKEDLAEFNTEIERLTQADKQAHIPKVSDVEHGLPQLKPGATPQDISKHYLDAASRIIQNAGVPDDQKKLIAEQFQKLAADAIKAAPKPPAQMTPYQTQELELRRESLNRPRGGGSSRGADGLTPYEELENKRWTQTHNPDGSPKAPSRADTTGLSNAGKEALAHDMTAWTLGGMDPASQPDPSSPKYQKRASTTGGGPTGASGGSAAAKPPAPSLPPTKVNPANGKTYYLHAADGKYYLTP
jgi:hypothetical protein